MIQNRIKILSLTALAFIAIMSAGGCSASDGVTLGPKRTAHLIDFAASQLMRTAGGFGDSVLYPRVTGDDGNWKTVQPRDWTSGFFPGCLWYAYGLNHDPVLQNLARKWTSGLAEQRFLRQTHDVGFIIYDSFGKGYEFTQDQEYKPVILEAARSLMTRYNPVVGCTKSWDGRKWGFPVIVDNMMNLELLFWASQNGGTRDMYDAAVSHARRTAENHFRPDGSSYHVVDYDTLTGKVISKETHQGYADESVWARGQAWAVYGFTIAYRFTRDEEFLKTAVKAADWFLGHLPEDFVPYWDFKLPDQGPKEKDVSASAIVASALLELEDYAGRPDLKERYHEAALRMIGSLSSPEYLAEGTKSRGILNHAVGNRPKNLEVDVSLIYADYYYLEALYRLRDSN